MCPDVIKSLTGISENFDKTDFRSMNGLTLAFIGDSVYELLIRQYILSVSDARVQSLHKESVSFANASFQAKAIEKLLPCLSEEETVIYKRGRNAHSSHTPRNKSEAEYHKATGFEALFGYLFLSGKFERIEELFQNIILFEK